MIYKINISAFEGLRCVSMSRWYGLVITLRWARMVDKANYIHCKYNLRLTRGRAFMVTVAVLKIATFKCYDKTLWQAVWEINPTFTAYSSLGYAYASLGYAYPRLGYA